MKRVAFRADATSQIGTGHFMRCLTLADALKQRGAEVLFVSRDLPAYLSEMLESRGMELMMLSGKAGVSQGGDLAHSHWLGVSQVEDAQETICALSSQEWDWLVVDHYALDARWERHLRGVVRKIMVIDDLADRAHDCEVLLDQNLYADMQTRYTGKVPAHSQLLLGPRYALLRDEFRELRKQVKTRTGEVRRILVFFGGVDADNFTGLAIEALAGSDIGDVDVDVVIGTQHPCREAIEAACAMQGYACHVQTSRMAELMATADLAIGAGGSASWERCCLGLPALLVASADNQIAIAEALDAVGACVYLGTKDSLDPVSLRSAITTFLSAPSRLEETSRSALSFVDGIGVDRICEALDFSNENFDSMH